MPLWMRKPLIGLIVLLLYPWVGLSGRADASFLLPREQERAERGAFSLPLGSHPEGEAQGSSHAPAESPAPTPGPAPVPGKPTPGPAHTGLQTNGNSTSSESSPSGGSGTAAGAVCLATGVDLLNATTRGGALFLLEQRNQPKPFSSRLFRPPRGVSA